MEDNVHSLTACVCVCVYWTGLYFMVRKKTWLRHWLIFSPMALTQPSNPIMVYSISPGLCLILPTQPQRVPDVINLNALCCCTYSHRSDSLPFPRCLFYAFYLFQNKCFCTLPLQNSAHELTESISFFIYLLAMAVENSGSIADLWLPNSTS